jgi:hypothetical protein
LGLVWKDLDLKFKRYEFQKLELDFLENLETLLGHWVSFFALLGRCGVTVLGWAGARAHAGWTDFDP